MKAKIVIGALFSVYILMMMPSISAEHFNTVKENFEKVHNINIKKIFTYTLGPLLTLLLQIIFLILGPFQRWWWEHHRYGR